MDITERLRKPVRYGPETQEQAKVRHFKERHEAADEIDRLRAEAVESDALREKLAGILSRTAVALRGPEPPLTRWSWHDLPERAASAIAAIDVMQRVAVMAAQESPPNVEFRGGGAATPDETTTAIPLSSATQG